MLIQNHESTKYVDFSQFTIDDLIDIYIDLDEIITGDDTQGNIQVDPKHSYTKMMALSYKFIKLETLPKHRPASPYQFI